MSAVTGVTLLVGAGLVLLAAVGVVRMPDLYSRMQAASKAATLGVALLVIGAALHFSDPAVSWRAALTALFLFVTAPVAAHVIARAGYRSGAPLAREAVVDELARDRRPGAP
ncbi:MAG: hypothetical protein Tsb0020_42510 [Haliangiales bacterium]